LLKQQLDSENDLEKWLADNVGGLETTELMSNVMIKTDLRGLALWNNVVWQTDEENPKREEMLKVRIGWCALCDFMHSRFMEQ
jgi:hypothetical protein